MALAYVEYYTYEDYKKWEGDWELIDGVPYAMSPFALPSHQFISGRILIQLNKNLENCKKHQKEMIEILKNFGLYDDELREAILSDYLNTMIVAIYRYCSPICNLSKKLRKKIIKIIINHKMTNEALTLYTPKTSLESRVMPLLLRQKDVDMIIEFATLKAKSIYQ